jgi:hypothetical protein
MTTTTGLILAICLTVISLACLTSVIFVIWWTMDSGRQHSYSAEKHQLVVLESMRESTQQAAQIVGIQAKLTETLLLGRAMPETFEQLETESTSETSLTPDEVWKQLPESIQENLIREREEASTWRSPSEMLHDPSPEEEQDPVPASQ